MRIPLTRWGMQSMFFIISFSFNIPRRRSWFNRFRDDKFLSNNIYPPRIPPFTGVCMLFQWLTKWGAKHNAYNFAYIYIRAYILFIKRKLTGKKERKKEKYTAYLNGRIMRKYIYNRGILSWKLSPAGSTSKLYLRSGYLIRILERCRNLHTINILGSRFRGRKFYRLLGDIGPRLRSVYAPATKSQFCTFIKYARQISETDRETICSMYIGVKSWAPLYYFVTKRADRVCTALISYLHNDILLIDANRSIHKLSITDRRNT